MKQKGWYSVLFVVTVVLLALPAVQQQWHLFNFRPLLGSTVSSERPQLTVKSFMSGQYQVQEDRYLSEHVGFRECFIRYYNQLTWSLFRKSQNPSVFVGKDNYLFNDFVMEHCKRQSAYVFYGSNEGAERRMRSDANMLCQLQGILASYGVNFFVCMAPSKDLVCEEYLPVIRESEKRDGIYAIDFYPHLFDSLGIHYLDLSEYFMQLKGNVSYPLYLKSSSHWSNQAATYMGDTLIRYMENLSGLNLHNLTFTPPYLAPTREPDGDLEQVLNLMRPIETNSQYYVNAIPDNDTAAVRPKWLVVGDSYFRGWQYNLPLDALFASHPYWRYNNTVYDDILHDNTSQVDLLRALLSADFVTLLYTPCNLYDLNRKFVTQSLFSLCFDEQEVAVALAEAKRQILNNDEWMSRLRQRADSRNLDLQQVIDDEASYMLYGSPGHYLDQFNEATVPAKRSSRVAKVYAEVHNPERERYRAGLSKNPDWLASIKEKAIKQQITVDEALERDIDWLIYQKKQNHTANE